MAITSWLTIRNRFEAPLASSCRSALRLWPEMWSASIRLLVLASACAEPSGAKPSSGAGVAGRSGPDTPRGSPAVILPLCVETVATRSASTSWALELR